MTAAAAESSTSLRFFPRLLTSFMKPTGKKEVIDADMVLLAMGFLKPEQPEFPENVFVAGDAARGASLVVHALADGRRVAQRVSEFFLGGEGRR